ncbi:4-hydroxy-tetrahydrodipicolinate reductase [Aliidiomarina celeris]|uniref:4-hydroxy-tetrahydrodipicolinate reductase n=1 Tax=Aliidiomarina celeris TaxID=2249428 RepID=UPI000DE8CE94|nr:4-hydroxy-tetrahydrodipicolinate reductase [Aliidiomarina celeris]
MAKIKVAVVGASGRMGREVIRALLSHPSAELVAALTHENSASVGIDAAVLLGEAACNVVLKSDFSDFNGAHVIVDFALPEGLSDRVQQYSKLQIPAVICATGLSASTEAMLHRVAQQIPLVYAANTSVGINILSMLVEQASAMLGLEADIEILEAHHTAKKDAPSGTALLLGDAAARGRGQSISEVAEYNRNNSEPYQQGSIGFATLRAGDIVGEHTVYLVTGSERLELTHRVASRATFANGALRAALWLVSGQSLVSEQSLVNEQMQGKSAGFYTMTDVLRVDGRA